MASYAMAARPTLYKGIRMRSRTEAAFAQYLDRVGISWAYEPVCFANADGQYLPDFQVFVDDPSRVPGFVEVKPPNFTGWDALRSQMEIIWDSEPTALLTIWIVENRTPIGGWVADPDLGEWHTVADYPRLREAFDMLAEALDIWEARGGDPEDEVAFLQSLGLLT